MDTAKPVHRVGRSEHLSTFEVHRGKEAGLALSEGAAVVLMRYSPEYEGAPVWGTRYRDGRGDLKSIGLFGRARG